MLSSLGILVYNNHRFSKPVNIVIFDTNNNYTKTTMKNLVVILFMLPSLAFGQQFLWSTIKSDSLKGYIPLERVPDKLVEYYRTYDKFFDGSGFSKDTFIETIEKSKLASSKEYALFKKIMDRVDQPTVMALKANDGKGSYITIMNMDENNVDLIVFSNNFIVHPMEYTTDLDKFKMLYKTQLW